MYGVITFLAWSMLGMCSLIFLAELADGYRRRRTARQPGAFNLEPRESALMKYFHSTGTGGKSWGGLNRFD